MAKEYHERQGSPDSVSQNMTPDGGALVPDETAGIVGVPEGAPDALVTVVSPQASSYPIRDGEGFTHAAVTRDSAYRGAGFMGAISVTTPERNFSRLDTSGTREGLGTNTRVLREIHEEIAEYADSARTLADFAGGIDTELVRGAAHYPAAVADTTEKATAMATIEALVPKHPSLAAALPSDDVRAALDREAAVLARLPEESPRIRRAIREADGVDESVQVINEPFASPELVPVAVDLTASDKSPVEPTEGDHVSLAPDVPSDLTDVPGEPVTQPGVAVSPMASVDTASDKTPTPDTRAAGTDAADTRHDAVAETETPVVTRLDAPHSEGQPMDAELATGDIIDAAVEIGSGEEEIPDIHEVTLTRSGEEVDVLLSSASATIAQLIKEGVTNKAELVRAYNDVVGGTPISENRFEHQILYNLREELAPHGLAVPFRVAKGEYSFSSQESREGFPKVFEKSKGDRITFTHGEQEVKGNAGKMLTVLDPFNPDRDVVTLGDLADASGNQPLDDFRRTLGEVKRWLVERGKVVETVRGLREAYAKNRVVVREAEPSRGSVTVVGEYLIRDGEITVLDPDEFRIIHQLYIGVTREVLNTTLTYSKDEAPRDVDEVIENIHTKADMDIVKRRNVANIDYYSMHGVAFEFKPNFIPVKMPEYLSAMQVVLEGGSQEEALTELNYTRRNHPMNRATASGALVRVATHLLNRGRAGLTSTEAVAHHPSEAEVYQQLEATVANLPPNKSNLTPEQVLITRIKNRFGMELPKSVLRGILHSIDLDAPAVGEKIREALAQQEASSNPTVVDFTE